MRYGFILTAILLTVNLHAYTLKGRIIQSTDYNPVREVTVGIKELSAVTSSDSNGYFMFENIEPGYYTLEFLHPLYERKTVLIRLKKNFIITIPLNRQAVKLQPMAKNSNSPFLLCPYQSISGDDIKKYPMRGFGDSLHLLQTLPGTGSGFSLATVPVIRGGNPIHDTYYIDHIPVKYPYHHAAALVPVFSAINEQVIDKASVLKGIAPINYDDNLGNVIKIKTVQANEPGLKAKVILDPLVPVMPGIFISCVPYSDISLIGCFRRSLYDCFSDFEYSDVSFQDHFVKIDYSLFSSHRFTFTALGCRDIMGFDDYYTSSLFHTESVMWTWLIASDLLLKTGFTSTCSEQFLENRDTAESVDGIYIKFKPATFRFFQEINTDLKNTGVRCGYEIIRDYGNVTGNININDTADPDILKMTGGAVKLTYPVKGTSFIAYTEGTADLDPFNITAGLKYKYYGPLGNHSFSYGNSV